jgi:acetyl esterase/lipase
MTNPTILSVFFSILFPLTCFSQTSQTTTVADAIDTAKKADEVIAVWKGDPPGPKRELDAEKDFTKPTDRLIAGKRIIKLGNVSAPQLHVFQAPAETRNGSAVVICPGGGFHILAWDLEGTEVAKWLNSLGVTAIVLKYRVPTYDQNPVWMAPVQDAQRAISLVRSHPIDWN